jgi:cell fate (sporulation/competence/biofilm development) regulator YmcA (YheA/YmcA/DUF963 family)
VDPVEELFSLLVDLDASKSTVTSIRQPVALREAVRVAVELGMAANPNEVTVQAVRDRLAAFAQKLALDQHLEKHPSLRPSLADLALVAAELDGHPLVEDPQLLRTAAAELAAVKPHATGEDVITYAMGMRSPSTARA